MFIDGEYGQIHLRVSEAETGPTAPPLVCLHMSPKSGRSFASFMTAASTDRTVVAPDYPGYGESDLPPAEPEVSLEDYARSVWQVIDALRLGQVDLLGHHTGSKVAAEMAFQRPDDVNRICMISAAWFSKAELAEFSSMFQPIPLDREGNRFRIMWERIIQFSGPGQTLEMMAESMAENLRGGEAYEWGHRAAFDYADRFIEIVPQLDHQIGVLNPGDELFEATRRIEPVLKNAVIRDYPQWGHGFLEAYTDDAVMAVKELLSF